MNKAIFLDRDGVINESFTDRVRIEFAEKLKQGE